MYLGYNQFIKRETININEVRIMTGYIKPTLFFTMLFSAVLFGREKARIPNKDVNLRFGLFMGSLIMLVVGWINYSLKYL